MERGLSILWIDAICGSVQNSMTPPLKERGPPSARLTRSASLRSTNGAAIGRYSGIMAEAERLRQSLLADAGRGDLRVELRPNGLRMIRSPVPFTPDAAPPNRYKVAFFALDSKSYVRQQELDEDARFQRPVKCC